MAYDFGPGLLLGGCGSSSSFFKRFQTRFSKHTLEQVLEIFETHEGAVAPVYDIGQIFDDPQFIARNDIITVADPELGEVKMQNVFPFLSRTPGAVRHAGPALGAHNTEVYCRELGLQEADLQRLVAEGTI